MREEAPEATPGAAGVADRLRDAAGGLPGLERVRAALRPGAPAWLVGGAVRDVLLGRRPTELDVVVLEDPVPLAARLGPVVGGDARFGTASVRDGPFAVDLARARTERYPAPGALPEVAPAARLEDDLPRRDVRINAIAWGLHDGRVVAVPGALEDLAARRLAVLHDRSFVDDPTRVWRLARYAGRLGLAVEPRTARLAGAADPGDVSADRHRAQLDLALGEPDPGVVLAALADLAPAYLPTRFAPRPPGVEEALALLGGEGRADLVRLAAATAGVEAAALQAWLRAVGLTPAERHLVGAASRESTLAPLRRARTPSEIVEAATGVPVEVVARAGGPNARRWLDELRHVRLEVDGSDLLAAGAPPGPAVGRALRAALAATVDGRLDRERPRRAAQLAAGLAAVAPGGGEAIGRARAAGGPGDEGGAC